MDVFALLVLAVALLFFSYKYFFPNHTSRYQQSARPFSFQNVKNLSKNSASKEKGDDFEKFVLNLFDFESDRFVLNEWRSDKYFNGIYPESNHYPDFEIRLNTKNGLAVFAVECKYRSSWQQNNTVEWAKSYQIDNYKKYAKLYDVPVFVALGIGGQPCNPKELYIIPVDNIHSCIIGYDQIQKSRKTNLGAKLFYNPEYQHLR